jgi:uncharacterized DUF497 family protein
MEFEWDEAKRRSNLDKHGGDFEDLAPLFEGAIVETPDNRRDYGERRIKCLGTIKGRVYFVAYVQRGNRRRIITARRANAREERTYYARHP